MLRSRGVTRSRRLADIALLLPSVFLACTSSRLPSGPADLPELAVADTDVRALLLLMVDRQWFEPLTVDRAARGDAALREELADALGRAGDSRGRGMLEGRSRCSGLIGNDSALLAVN